jgi:hypothetical protein
MKTVIVSSAYAMTTYVSWEKKDDIGGSGGQISVQAGKKGKKVHICLFLWREGLLNNYLNSWKHGGRGGGCSPPSALDGTYVRISDIFSHY